MNARVFVLSAVVVCLVLAIAASIVMRSPESGVISTDEGAAFDDSPILPGGDDPLPTEVADDGTQEQTPEEEVTPSTVLPIIVPANQQQVPPNELVQPVREDVPASPILADLDISTPFPLPPEFGDTVREFAYEDDDPTWSDATESRIFSEISLIPRLEATDIQVECRTTMCRIRMVHPRNPAPGASAGNVSELVEAIGMEAPWLFAVPDENGNPTSLVYVQRGKASTQSIESAVTAAR